jgi:hypothetical protein
MPSVTTAQRIGPRGVPAAVPKSSQWGPAPDGHRPPLSGQRRRAPESYASSEPRTASSRFRQPAEWESAATVDHPR